MLMRTALAPDSDDEVSLYQRIPYSTSAPVPQLRILTWNVWGLPLAFHRSSFHLERIEAIRKQLEALPADVVALQEVWAREILAAMAAAGYTYYATGARAGSLVGGSGLMTLSRHPIVRTSFTPFANRRGIEKVIRKGVLHTRIRVGDRSMIDVLNVHLVSEPERGSHLLLDDPETREVRRAQLEEVRYAADRIKSQGIPVVIAGDFNIDDLDPEAAQMRRYLGLDSFAACQPHSIGHGAGGATFDPESNSHARSPHNKPQRLDYVWLYRSWEEALPVSAVRMFDSQMLSDHYAVMSGFYLATRRNRDGIGYRPSVVQAGASQEPRLQRVLGGSADRS